MIIKLSDVVNLCTPGEGGTNQVHNTPHAINTIYKCQRYTTFDKTRYWLIQPIALWLSDECYIIRKLLLILQKLGNINSLHMDYCVTMGLPLPGIILARTLLLELRAFMLEKNAYLSLWPVKSSKKGKKALLYLLRWKDPSAHWWVSCGLR